MNKLKAIVLLLTNCEPLEPKHRDHELIGNYAYRRECHIEPDWLLINQVSFRNGQVLTPEAPEKGIVRVIQYSTHDKVVSARLFAALPSSNGMIPLGITDTQTGAQPAGPSVTPKSGCSIRGSAQSSNKKDVGRCVFGRSNPLRLRRLSTSAIRLRSLQPM